MLPSLNLLPLAIAALLPALSVYAQEQQTCSLTKKCPKEAPCCSQYGVCGVGAYCLGGCDPRMSFSLDACVPAPVCQDKVLPMNSLDRIVNMNKYLGDPSTADWVYQGEPALYNNNVILTMPPQSVGTILTSTVYMWYGTVKAKVKTSLDAGVVTAFILYGDVKDEIDFEWVGTELDIAQTNYYFQGNALYDQGGNITGVSNTYENWHEYEIRWTPDQIDWLVDGKVGRTKKRSDTFNATSNQFSFPQTPARVQLSIWPGGAATNPKGTVDWAGGPIDWASPYIKANGFYFATFGEISIECYKTNTPPGTNSGKSYWYTDIRSTNDTVMDGDKPTILKSFSATGLDMGVDDSPQGELNQIPGGGSAGSGHENTGGAVSGGSTNPSDCSASGFSQNCRGNSNEAPRYDERMLGASTFAAAVALMALMCI